jgi:hypothetical protein
MGMSRPIAAGTSRISNVLVRSRAPSSGLILIKRNLTHSLNPAWAVQRISKPLASNVTNQRRKMCLTTATKFGTCSSRSGNELCSWKAMGGSKMSHYGRKRGNVPLFYTSNCTRSQKQELVNLELTTSASRRTWRCTAAHGFPAHP